MMHHFNQRVTADAKRYHTWLYVKCTMIYGHICTQIWRSVSGSGHGNMIFDTFPRETRVRSPPPQSLCLISHVQWIWHQRNYSTILFSFSADDSGSGVGVCGLLLTWISWLLVVVTLPFSLCVCFKVSLTYWNSIGNSTSPNLKYLSLTKRSNMPWRSFFRNYFTHLPSFC